MRIPPLTAPRLAFILAATAVSFVGEPQARAADAELESLLSEDVVTTASKTPETSSSAPAITSTITAEDLRIHGILTLADALTFLGHGMLMASSARSTDTGARGLLLPLDTGSHVLLLVDGHVTNAALTGWSYPGAALGVPIEMIDHIEVVLGPGAVLYGGNAMFGVLNVVTRKGKDFQGVRVGADAAPGREWRLTAGAGRPFELLGQTGEFIVGAEHVEYHYPLDVRPINVGRDAVTGGPVVTRPGGPADGIYGGTWDHNQSTVSSGYLRVSLGAWELRLRALTQRSSHPHVLFDFDNPDAYESRRAGSLGLSYHASIGSLGGLRLRVYGDESRERLNYTSISANYCRVGMNEGCTIRFDGGAERLGSEVQADFDWRGDVSQVSLVGVDARVDHLAFVSNALDKATGDNPGSLGYYNRWLPTLGVYAQHVSNLTSWMTANAGVRLDRDPRFDTAVSPRAALMFEPWSGGTLKLLYSSAFRAPTVGEEHGASVFIVSPKSLEPERVHSFEAVIDQRLGVHHVSLGLFSTTWSDMVVLVPLSTDEIARAKSAGELSPFMPAALHYANASRIESKGMTVGYDATSWAKRIRYGVSATEAVQRQDSSGLMDDSAPPATSPRLHGNAHFSVECLPRWLTVGLAGAAQDRVVVGYLTPSIQYTGIYAPASARARLTFTGELPWLAGLRYRAGAQLATTELGTLSVVSTTPIQSATPEYRRGRIERYRVFFGVEYAAWN